MDNTVKNDVLDLLNNRAPNFVSKTILKNNLPQHDKDSLETALRQLKEEARIERETDKCKGVVAPMDYYKVTSFKNIPIRETIKVGDSQIPRVLSYTDVEYFPENFNEAIEKLARLATCLESRLEERIKKYQREYWAKIGGVFTIFLGIIAIVFSGIPKVVVDTSLGLLRSLLYNFVAILPFAAVFVGFAFLMRWIIKR